MRFAVFAVAFALLTPVAAQADIPPHRLPAKDLNCGAGKLLWKGGFAGQKKQSCVKICGANERQMIPKCPCAPSCMLRPAGNFSGIPTTTFDAKISKSGSDINLIQIWRTKSATTLKVYGDLKSQLAKHVGKIAHVQAKVIKKFWSGSTEVVKILSIKADSVAKH